MRSLLVVNKTGGVGKTTISELLNIYLDKHDYQYDLYSIEGQGVNVNYSSPLKRAVPHTRDMFFQSPHQYGAANESDYLQIWTDVLEPVFKGKCLVDFGANALSGYQYACALLDNGNGIWDVSEPEDGYLRPVMVVPISANHNSIYDSIDLLEWLFKHGGINNFHHIIVVRNQFRGSVIFYEALEALISSSQSKISLIDLELNEHEYGMQSLSQGMATMKKFMNSSKERGSYMMKDSNTLFQLASMRSIDRWLHRFESQLSKIKLLQLLTPQAPTQLLSEDVTESFDLKFE